MKTEYTLTPRYVDDEMVITVCTGHGDVLGDVSYVEDEDGNCDYAQDCNDFVDTLPFALLEEIDALASHGANARTRTVLVSQ